MNILMLSLTTSELLQISVLGGPELKKEKKRQGKGRGRGRGSRRKRINNILEAEPGHPDLHTHFGLMNREKITHALRHYLIIHFMG